MKTTRSSKKAAIGFCCTELYEEICEKDFPRIRLEMERGGNIRPVSDKTIFKFCPFCGEVVRTTLIFDDKHARAIAL